MFHDPLNSFWKYNKEMQYYCNSVMYYILLKICKKVKKYKLGNNDEWDYQIETSYKEIDFMHIKWIIDRANFRCAKRYGNIILDYESLDFFMDFKHAVPEAFSLIKNKYTYLDYLCDADKECLDKLIKRWKLYGKYIISIDNFMFKLKWRLRRYFYEKKKEQN